MLRALSSHESTLVFRTMLSALAFPGRRFDLPSALVQEMPAPVVPLLALVDIETTFHSHEHSADIAMVTSAPLVALNDARFVLFGGLPSAADVSLLGRGTAHQPEFGCKVVVAVAALPESSATPRNPMTLTGPGIRGSLTLDAPAEFGEFVAARHDAVADAPAGIDCWLVAHDGGVMGLPRTTRIATSTAAAAANGH